jgi:sugar phosphate isomerase/epimerase
VIPTLLTDSVSQDLDRAVSYALLWGLEGVALRTVGGERVPHVNEALLRHRLTEADLPIVAVDPGLFEAPHGAPAAWLNDLASFAETARFCRRVGCSTVLTGALAGMAGEAWSAREAGPVLARLAGEAYASGLRIAVRNDDATACRSGEDLAGLLAAAREACASDGERDVLGAAWNPAAAARSGSGAEAGLAALQSGGVPVYSVSVEDTSLLAGALDWGYQLRTLSEAGFNGPIIMEVSGRPAGPAGLKASNAMLAALRSPS